MIPSNRYRRDDGVYDSIEEADRFLEGLVKGEILSE